MDREKVAKGLHHHCEGSMFDRCGECPYYEIDHEPFICRDMLLNDLNAMLKEKEAIEPDVDSEGTCTCGNCGENVGWYPVVSKEPVRLCKFCSECGQEVKWE